MLWVIVVTPLIPIFRDSSLLSVVKSPSLSFFLFGLILLAAQDGFAQRANDYYKLGLDFLEQGQYEKAFETMSTAASLSKKQGDWPLYFKALAKSGETGFR